MDDNPHVRTVKEIINKVRNLRGKDPTASSLLALNQSVQKRMLAQEFRTQNIKDTVE